MRDANRKLPTWIVGAALVVTAGFAGCASKSNEQPALGNQADVGTVFFTPLNSRVDHKAATLFTRLTPEESGITLVHQFPEDANFQRIQDQASASGVAIGDIDGDELPDIFFTNYTHGNRLYRNLGNWKFEDITGIAGVSGKGHWGSGPALVDIDNDDDLDIFVAVFDGANLLYLNDGHGVFTQQPFSSSKGPNVMMAFADYDLDGDLDGYLVTHRIAEDLRQRMPDSSEESFQRGILVRDKSGEVTVAPQWESVFCLADQGDGSSRVEIAGWRDVLYRNDGASFKPVTRAAGIDGHHIGLAARWWDYNEDGWPDLYVSNDYIGPDKLYRNKGDGTFVDVSREVFPHTPAYSMGSDAADINNDGHIDFLATDMLGTNHYEQKLSMGDMEKGRLFLVADPPQYMRNAVYLNTGGPRMFEAAYLTNLASSDWTWSPKFADLDNDGWVDLFIANGMTRDFMNSDWVTRPGGLSKWEKAPLLKQENLAFKNLGDLHFRPAEKEWGLNHEAVSYGAALADLDRDGDLDLVVTNFNEAVSVYRNNSQQGNSILVRLRGTVSNRMGIGARVTVKTASHTHVQTLTSGQGFMSANEPLLHFGLGDEQTIQTLTVQWPVGVTQTIENLKAGVLCTLVEPNQKRNTNGGENPGPTHEEALFHPSDIVSHVRHVEQPFDDFKRQPLLPAKHSQLGPGIAVGDVDGDGRDDLYVGGATGKSGKLILMKDPATSHVVPFEEDRDREDLGALLFDADSDGDLDLYVVSGGVEHDPGSPMYRDRLYFNDATGQFTKAPENTLPDVRDSGAAVAGADFDRDGDIDLFVGGRVVPGQYPTSPTSRLYVNDEGIFLDATDKLAPGLSQSGMVTSAIWSDADGDGWLDLLVTYDWGPVAFYRNEAGVLQNQTDKAGLSQFSGWWNGIHGADIDGDGDIDYAATNLGLNTKYNASAEHPVVLYYGDFQGDGSARIIEAQFEEDILYPERGRSCSCAAVPMLRERFPSFDLFARATLDDIYTPLGLDGSQQFEANTLTSVLFVNNGNAQFEMRPLPRLAQIAPCYGVVFTDINSDGNVDLFVAQNSYSPQLETGRMAGGMSLLLLGTGDGRFQPMWPKASGITIPGDAKAASVVDLNGDGSHDLLVSVNDDRLCAFENQSAPGSKALVVSLRGNPGNVNAIGSRVTITTADGQRQTAEVYAGGSYLAQSTSALHFGLGERGKVKEVLVRWPNGKISRETQISGKRLRMAMPGGDESL